MIAKSDPFLQQARYGRNKDEGNNNASKGLQKTAKAKGNTKATTGTKKAT